MIMTTTPRIPLPPGALKAEDWQPDGKRLLRGTKRGERVHIDILSCVLSACATGAASSASSASPQDL